MHELMVDGVRLAYHVHGNGPVCLVHPGGPGIHWPYLRLPALEKHLTMVYVEPPGTGNSGLLPDGDYSMTRYASFVDRLARHLGESKVFVLGHSHGGFVALQTALDHPERLAGIIVYDGMAFNGPELGEQASRNIDAYVGRRPPGDPLAAQVLQAWQDDPADREEQLDALRRLLPVYFKDYEAIEGRLTDWGATIDLTIDPNRKDSRWDIRGRLGEIAVPALVLVGVADFICPENSARELADGIPGSELIVLAESGHFGHLEQPDVFRDCVVEFVRRVS
ncbi:alpha/beta fold hydrolase [Kribbella turkmenica]|uniref:alpha/beta fold hydrolase n=1 Tax=Kribbella turkmenica TaxID=2530375 RepID=UPI00140552F9|nr:alpha/beta hydrolase [Kribbella turkmenica]